MRKILLIVICICICKAEKSLIQYEGKVNYSLLQSHPSVDPDGSDGFQFISDLHSSRNISENFLLYFDHHFRGVNSGSLYPEYFCPNENISSAGIEFLQFGDFSCNVSNTLYPNANSVPVPYYNPDTKVQPKMLNVIEGRWIIEKNWFHCSAEVASFSYSFKLDPLDPFTSLSDTEKAPYGDMRDNDLWADFSAGFDIPISIAVNGGFALKNDLCDYDNYNMETYWLGFTGEQHLKPNRLMLYYQANEKFLESKIMHEKGYADGLSSEIKVRLLWRKNAKLFVKGEADVECADQLFKQYYELQLRKNWGANSSLDVIYFATNGVLFPRQGLRIASRINIFDHFGFAPSSTLYLSKSYYQSEFRFYRGDFSAELFIPIGNSFEIFSGAIYSHYERHPLYASRSIFSIGLRTW